jgi:biotin operon repressor
MVANDSVLLQLLEDGEEILRRMARIDSGEQQSGSTLRRSLGGSRTFGAGLVNTA